MIGHKRSTGNEQQQKKPTEADNKTGYSFPHVLIERLGYNRMLLKAAKKLILIRFAEFNLGHLPFIIHYSPLPLPLTLNGKILSKS